MHKLLQSAQINGPIILADHSLGGIVSLIYSAEHEEQVVGIAFVNSSHYNQINHFGREFAHTVDKEIEGQLSSIGLIELLSLLLVCNMAEKREQDKSGKQQSKFNEDKLLL